MVLQRQLQFCQPVMDFFAIKLCSSERLMLAYGKI